MLTRSKCLVRQIALLALFSLPVANGWAAEAPIAGKTAGKEATPSYLAGVPLIDRETLLGDPDHAAPRISPDGKQLAFLAPVNGVLNVWVGPLDKPEAAKPVTHDASRGVRSYFWAYNNRQILYLQDVAGNENWHVYRADLETGKTTDLTPLENVRAEILAVGYRFPDKILVGLNSRDPQVFDVYQLDLASGKRELVEKNTDDFSNFVIDEDYRIRFGIKMTDSGAKEMLAPDGKGGWKLFLTIPPSDTLTTSPITFDKSGNTLYMIDSRDRNTAALASYDMKTGKETVLAQNPRADVDKVLIKPIENTVQAASFDYERRTWQVVDPAVAEDLATLQTVSHGDPEFSSQSLDDRQWIVAFLVDDGPVRFYHYDRNQKKAHFLFASRKDLQGLPLVRMHPLTIKSRDGLELVSYLSLPPNTTEKDQIRPRQPLPMVLDVHGGPWARDTWGFNPAHQLWANRGYAVLSVNFRGSTGFGKTFVNAGNRQWGGKMQDDLVDAVHWAIQEKIADPHRIAIAGGSYGGYATLEALTRTPELFACGVDIVGPSNLLTLLRSLPPYWKPEIELFKMRVGDFGTPEGQRFLEQESPLSHVDRIVRPLLIAQGANDPRVKKAESDQMVAALERRQIPVTYVLFPDEGHGFVRPANRLAFFAVTEAFLAEHLGGRYQSIGNAFAQSTITFPKGESLVPGLESALKPKGTIRR